MSSKKNKEVAPADVDPDKWDRCVADVTAAGSADNAYAVCTAVLRKAGTGKKKEDVSEEDIHEAASSLGYGQLLKSKSKEQAVPLRIREMNIVRIKEAVVDEKGNKRYPVRIISAGLGNLRDRNFYTPQAIASGVKLYEGAKACIDHPTADEEQENPNRNVMDLAGHYENVTVGKGDDGAACLEGELVPIAGDSCKPTTERLDHAVAYKKKYPDKNFVGISINGNGKGQKMSYDDFMSEYGNILTPTDKAKLKEVEGQDINAITELTDRVSADIVTEPGAGGVVKTQESNFKPKRRIKMFKAMKEYFAALASGDKKAIVKAQEALAKEADANATEADAAEKKEKEKKERAEAMAEALKCAKKENKKEEKETDEAYEARMMQAAMESVEKKDKEKKEKEAADAAAGKDGAGGKGDKDNTEGGDGKNPPPKKGDKDGSKDDDDDDDDDDDGKPAAKDMKALKKQNEKLSKEVEELKAELKKEKKESKESAEKAAISATELTIKKRNELIDKKLAESGLRREVTAHWKPVLEKCRSEEEIEVTVKKLVETAKKVLEDVFEIESSYGLIEKQATDTSKTNDDLFLK